MKIVLTFFCFFLGFSMGHTQNKIDGFLGIKFGDTKLVAKKTMLGKKAVIATSLDSNLLYYKNVPFGGRIASTVFLSFHENKFYLAVAMFEPALKVNIVNDYKSIKEDINLKYFSPNSETEEYVSPYTKNDGYTESAIQLGKAKFKTTWTYGYTEPSLRSIILMIEPELKVSLTYFEHNTYKLVMALDKYKNLSDF